MTSADSELLAPGGQPPAASGEDTAHRIEAERQRIGRLLHQTILQELTVAGLHLKRLEDAAPEPTAAAIAELSDWLRQRQSELRRVVTELEQGRRGDGAADLAAVAANLRDRYGCDMNVDPHLEPGRFDPQIWSAMIDTVGGVGQILARELSSRRIDLVAAPTGQPSVRLRHDGQGIGDSPAQLAAVRTLVGRNGASLQIERAGASEQLILDWAS